MGVFLFSIEQNLDKREKSTIKLIPHADSDSSTMTFPKHLDIKRKSGTIKLFLAISF